MSKIHVHGSSLTKRMFDQLVMWGTFDIVPPHRKTCVPLKHFGLTNYLFLLLLLLLLFVFCHFMIIIIIYFRGQNIGRTMSDLPGPSLRA